MSEQNNFVAAGEDQSEILEFVPDETEIFSSGVFRANASPDAPDANAAEIISKGVEVPMAVDEKPSAFHELSEPRLPRLERENRARLLMQTPNRLYFYWSTAANPFQTLGRAIGGHAGNYSLVLKLAELKRGVEEIRPIEQEGTCWFDVEAKGEYRVEIGFYSPSRPFVRIMYSNIVETPRKNPSPHTADEAEWRVSSDRFAKVLNVAGFKQDAFDVAITGDDQAASDGATRKAFFGFIGRDVPSVDDISAEEIRYSMLALAAGVPLESLKYRIGARLFALLQSNAGKLSAANALKTVREHFAVEADETLEEERLTAVYGSSVVNFPRTLKRRRGFPGKFESVSSHSFEM